MKKCRMKNQAFFLFTNQSLFFIDSASSFDGRLSNTTRESDAFFSSFRVFCIWKDYLFSVRKKKRRCKK